MRFTLTYCTGVCIHRGKKAAVCFQASGTCDNNHQVPEENVPLYLLLSERQRGNVGWFGMVSHWRVIMYCTWIIVDQIQASDLVCVRQAASVRQTAKNYTDSCRAGQCNANYFLELAPCPPPTKSHLVCDIDVPLNLTCSDRTDILRNCIGHLSEDARTRVFRKCNQSERVQCDDFVNLCQKFSKFNCGKPSPTEPPPTTFLPQITTQPTTAVLLNSSGMNDSGLTVNDTGPEVMNAGVGDRNWWPLLSLLVIPLIVILVFVVFLCRKRRSGTPRKDEKSTPDIHNGEEKLIKIEIFEENRKKHRDSYIGYGDQFEKLPYIDEDTEDNAFTEEAIDDTAVSEDDFHH